MIEHKSWDSSLVKKYSSSNHFKLLNQLRNEVKKYPLINKKNIIKSNSKSTTKSNKINEAIEPKDSNNTNQIINKQSTVSFNNSKNFSIYNGINEVYKNQTETDLLIENKSNDQSTSSSFKDRLNQVDMK